ncbi:MAG TPA: hypothetical protein VMT91_05515 [Anaerolineales bacterium]|nr:hypothetical protein [Anaerolineales bacterium]
MKLPDPAKEDTLPEKEKPEPPADKQPKRRFTFGFYREPSKDQPDETVKKSAPRTGGQPAPRSTIKLPAMPLPKAEPPEAAPPEDETNPGRRLHIFEAAAKEAPPAKIPLKYRLRPTRETTHRAYWDIATTFSLIINIILVCLVVIMALQIRNLKATVGSLNTLANNVLGGLYGNFVKMDQASISTVIPIDTQIPLSFNLPVTQNTTVVLTNDVTIPKAHVVINTGGLNINSLASVTLPAGTSLPIALNLNIPVQYTVPVSMQVPVTIPLNQTQLHEPFTGLQATIRPLYCMLNKNAQYPEGTYICAEQAATSTGTP